MTPACRRRRACGPRSSRRSAQSRFLILLASPEAAASPWVNKEVAYWLDHKGADTLLIALTDGELAWDNAVGDFVWREGMPLPPVLTGRFATEPKWVDLRAYRDGANPRDARFTELPPISPPPSTACRRRTCCRRRCASSAAR